MELNVWTSATLNSSKYDDAAGKWTLEIIRKDGSKRILSPSSVVLATGLAGDPVSYFYRKSKVTSRHHTVSILALLLLLPFTSSSLTIFCFLSFLWNLKEHPCLQRRREFQRICLSLWRTSICTQLSWEKSDCSWKLQFSSRCLSRFLREW